MSKIEILGQGMPFEAKVDVQCVKCMSLLRIPRDATKHRSSPRPDDDDFYECRCPVCKERIIIYPHQFK